MSGTLPRPDEPSPCLVLTARVVDRTIRPWADGHRLAREIEGGANTASRWCDSEVSSTVSIVAATYKEGSRPMGAVGIIGPTRMNYLQAISIVDLTAKYITEMLSL